MPLNPLLPLMYEPLVKTALLEDLGRAGDITADAIVPAELQAKLVMRARQPGVVAGLDVARCVFQTVSPAIDLRAERPDGSPVEPGQVIAIIDGPARGLLTGERTALNFLCHLSGVATATASRSLPSTCCSRPAMPSRAGCVTLPQPSPPWPSPQPDRRLTDA